MSSVIDQAQLAKKTTHILSGLTTEQKNSALLTIADALVTRQEEIMTANQKDLENGEQNGLRKSLLDRLALNKERIDAMAEGLKQISKLPDPIGDVLEEIDRPNGLLIRKVRVPIGLIGIVYEARPNVTVDAAGLCLKSGNAVVLRGGSSALYSNQKIVEIIHDALKQSGLPENCVQLVMSADRSSVDELLKLNGIIDVIIPRGGQSLIQNVIRNATVPVIETGAGICHTYIDADANVTTAFKVAINAKVQRPSVCNAMETLLVHDEFAKEHLSDLADKFKEQNVDLRGCEQSRKWVPWMNEAGHDDFHTEYNDYVLNVKVVHSLEEAIEHIHYYGTNHSECIITENNERAAQFLNQVDAAAVYHNASTRFTDGFEFGFGAEIGISTQKLHARGPMGLPALTSTKYLVFGNGQIK